MPIRIRVSSMTVTFLLSRRLANGAQTVTFDASMLFGSTGSLNISCSMASRGGSCIDGLEYGMARVWGQKRARSEKPARSEIVAAMVTFLLGSTYW